MSEAQGTLSRAFLVPVIGAAASGAQFSFSPEP